MREPSRREAREPLACAATLRARAPFPFAVFATFAAEFAAKSLSFSDAYDTLTDTGSLPLRTDSRYGKSRCAFKNKPETH
jgi:hypothetical protein